MDILAKFTNALISYRFSSDYSYTVWSFIETDNATLNHTCASRVRICVEVDLTMELVTGFPDSVFSHDMHVEGSKI